MQPGMFGLQISGILQSFIFYFATELLVGPESSLVNVPTRLKINPIAREIESDSVSPLWGFRAIFGLNNQGPVHRLPSPSPLKRAFARQ